MLLRLKSRVIAIGAPFTATLILLIVSGSWIHASAALNHHATAPQSMLVASDHGAAHHDAHGAHQHHSASEAERDGCADPGCNGFQCCVGAVELVSPVAPNLSPPWTKHRRPNPDRLVSRSLKPATHPPKRV